MNLRGWRRRLERLERRHPGPEAAHLPRHLWRILCGAVDLGDLDVAEHEKLRRFIEEAEAAHARCMERNPAAKCYREQLTRLGLPQPPTLVGIDLIEESIRLAGIPTPGASANGHLCNGATTRPGAEPGPRGRFPGSAHHSVTLRVGLGKVLAGLP